MGPHSFKSPREMVLSPAGEWISQANGPNTRTDPIGDPTSRGNRLSTRNGTILAIASITSWLRYVYIGVIIGTYYDGLLIDHIDLKVTYRIDDLSSKRPISKGTRHAQMQAKGFQDRWQSIRRVYQYGECAAKTVFCQDCSHLTAHCCNSGKSLNQLHVHPITQYQQAWNDKPSRVVYCENTGQHHLNGHKFQATADQPRRPNSVGTHKKL